MGVGATPRGGRIWAERWRGGFMAAALIALAPAIAADAPIAAATATVTATIDPLTIADDDFARNRDPALWRDLAVSRIVFTEGTATWRLWRIANLARPAGPLWMVTHDNENATFVAGLSAVRSWGGVMMVVDTGPVDTLYAARFNREVTGRPPIDPNRNFLDSAPLYAATMLADLRPEGRLIVALHTNAPDFDPRYSDCLAKRSGRGLISVGFCNSRYQPRAAAAKAWPFDDDDSLMLVPYLDGQGRGTAFCTGRLIDSDANLVFERVAVSDGSLSNYAVQHGLPYINVETEERGSDPAGIALARDRLVNMIDRVMERCADLPGVALKPPRRR